MLSGEGNGNPLQYSCLEKPMNREAWWATVHGVTESSTRLSEHIPCLGPICIRTETKNQAVTANIWTWRKLNDMAL